MSATSNWCRARRAARALGRPPPRRAPSARPCPRGAWGVVMVVGPWWRQCVGHSEGQKGAQMESIEMEDSSSKWKPEAQSHQEVSASTTPQKMK